MDFFKSVFSDDPPPAAPQSPQSPVLDPVSDPNPGPAPSGAWSFGGLIKTLATKSESVIESYRRDLEEFGSGLRKETAVIREAASRAVKDLPTSLEAGASVAQESLESVGQAIDDIGATVLKSTAEILSHGKEALLDLDSDSSENGNGNFGSSGRQLNSAGARNSDVKKYSRFDAQLRAIQSDVSVYCDEPEDSEEYGEWKLGFSLEEKREEIESLTEEGGAMKNMYDKVVPEEVDHENFWSRYFYRVHKLKVAEDARARLVKRAISGDEEEDLRWDFEDEDEEGDALEVKGENVELVKNVPERAKMEDTGETSSSSLVQALEKSAAGEEEKSDSEKSGSDALEVKVDGRANTEGKTDKSDTSESCKDSDVSIISMQPSMPEEADLGWDEIEDVVSNDEEKRDSVSSASRVDLRQRLSMAEEEDLTWDIEDDDEPPKL